MRRSFENLSYLSNYLLSHKDGDSEEYAWTYYDVLNQTLLSQKYQWLFLNTFYGLEGYGTR